MPAVFLYRFSNFLYYKLKLKRISRIIDWINRLLFSIWLPGSAKIGNKLIIGYFGLGVVVHSNCKIGNHCQINQNVTIGRNFGDVKVPVIGNSVYIGAGSVVFGEITIGDNVIIGANSVVNKSFPSNCIIAGNPAKILKEGTSKNYFQLDFKK